MGGWWWWWFWNVFVGYPLRLHPHHIRITPSSQIIHPISFHSPCTSCREIESLLLSSPTSA